MNLVRFGYRPSFSSMIDEVFGKMVNENTEMSCRPAANLREDAREFKAELMLPGFEKEEISVNIEKNILTVSAKHESTETNDSDKYTWNEFSRMSQYKRSFVLPESVNADGIKAEYRNGILNISIPKVEPVQEPVKQISIQ